MSTAYRDLILSINISIIQMLQLMPYSHSILCYFLEQYCSNRISQTNEYISVSAWNKTVSRNKLRNYQESLGSKISNNNLDTYQHSVKGDFLGVIVTRELQYLDRIFCLWGTKRAHREEGCAVLTLTVASGITKVQLHKEFLEDGLKLVAAGIVVCSEPWPNMTEEQLEVVLKRNSVLQHVSMLMTVLLFIQLV